jgi:hypothetical protein
MDPMVHYIPLKKDFSNFDDVLAALKDDGLRRRITDRAYEDMIASGRYGYASLIADVDRELAAAGLTSEVGAEERARITGALREGRRQLRFNRWRERTAATSRHLLYRVVAPVSARVRRALGLPVPTS